MAENHGSTGVGPNGDAQIDVGPRGDAPMGDGDLGESQAEDRPRDDGSSCESQAAHIQTNDTASRAMVRRLEEVAAQLQQEVARLGGMQHAASATQQLALLRDELHGMGELIANTRAEIAGLMPLGAPSSRLTSASDELDAVVGATERAAVEIMGAAEHAQEAAQRLRKINGLPVEALRDLDQVEAAAVDIFMACSFQDLTGQRIRKVVQALTYIEKRIIALTVLWRGAGRGAGWGDAAGAAADGAAADGATADGAAAWDTRRDAHLLNGPSDGGLPQAAVDSLLHDAVEAGAASQDAIDAMFA